jgi:hypothetical protein
MRSVTLEGLESKIIYSAQFLKKLRTSTATIINRRNVMKTITTVTIHGAEGDSVLLAYCDVIDATTAVNDTYVIAQELL